MGANTEISWTDATFNPWWGCTKVGPGCDHCYAEAFDRRVGGSHWGAGAPRRLIKDWSGPMKWQREAERTGRRPWVFCASMADVFDNEVPGEWRTRLWQTIELTPLLNWQIVTKRIGNAAKMMRDPAVWRERFRHVGVMATVVDQEEADRDVPKLLALKRSHSVAWVGLSMEPLLDHVDLASHVIDLDWIIVGGESGPRARPMNPSWARSLRDQSAAAGKAFHFKQWGEFVDVAAPEAFVSDCGRADPTTHTFGDGEVVVRVGKHDAGRLLDGVEHNDRPRLAALGRRDLVEA